MAKWVQDKCVERWKDRCLEMEAECGERTKPLEKTLRMLFAWIGGKVLESYVDIK